jgi:rhodanese-related sulfurtransferase
MSIPTTTPTEVKAKLANGEAVTLLDVREPDEVAAWSYPGAITIPLGEIEARFAELPTGVTITCACRAGGRSLKAATFLASKGFDVENLEGGQLAWMDEA